MESGGREFYITGHLEYAATITLSATNIWRDKGKRDDVEMPQHYSADSDDPEPGTSATWRAHAISIVAAAINHCMAGDSLRY